jgi:hypothetical protein
MTGVSRAGTGPRKRRFPVIGRLVAKPEGQSEAAARYQEIPMAKQTGGRKWSAKVTETSDALDLKTHIFEQDDPAKIAASLKRSAEHSHRRKGTPFQSAMSMLTFYINRAGKNLSASRKRKLDDAKDELREQFHRKPG